MLRHPGTFRAPANCLTVLGPQFHRAFFANVCVTALLGCAPERLALATSGAAPLSALNGASFAADGMASVDRVAASPYPDEPPPELATADTLIDRYARENGLSLGQAKAQINGDEAFRAEMARLGEVLQRDQSENFLGFRLVRDPAVAVEVSFAHDAAATLARYTKNPRFRPIAASKSRAETRALADLWQGRLQQEQIDATFSRDDLTGRLGIELGISETEWRALARKRGWVWGFDVSVSYAKPAPAALREPDLADHIRVFPRSTSAATIVLSSATSGRVVLDHGCFRLAAEHGRGDLVVFDRTTSLGRDSQGFLAVFERDSPSMRIGERAIWGGYPGAREQDADIKELRAKCGDGVIISVGVPTSERLFALPYPEWVANYAKAKRLTYRQAWTKIIACMKRREAGSARGLQLREGCYQQFN